MTDAVLTAAEVSADPVGYIAVCVVLLAVGVGCAYVWRS